MTSPTTVKLPSQSNTQQSVQLPAWVNQAGQQAVNQASKIAATPYPEYTGQLVAGQDANTKGAIDLIGGIGNVGSDATGRAGAAAGAATGMAAGAIGTGQGALSNAGDMFNNASSRASSPNQADDFLGRMSAMNNYGNYKALSTADAGQDQMSAANRLLGQSDAAALNSQNAGQGSLANARDTGNQASTLATNSQNAGADTINTGAAAARGLTGEANATLGAGSGDAALMSALARLTAGGAVASGGAGQSDLDAARAYTAKSTAPITGEDIASYMNPYIKASLDPAALEVQRAADRDLQGLKGTAAMRGAFGGSRQGLLEGENERNKIEGIGNIYQTGYANAFDKASSMASDALGRNANAAGLSQGTAGLSDTLSNDAIQRLISSGNQLGASSSLQSNLATEGQNRVANAATTAGDLGARQSTQANDALSRLISSSGNMSDLAGRESGLANDALTRLTGAAGARDTAAQTESGLANDALSRLTSQEGATAEGARTANDVNSSNVNNMINAGQAQQGLAGAQSQAASSDLDRVLSTVNPNLQVAQSQFTQVQQQINDMLQAGQINQQQAQNELDAAYSQYTDQRNWAANQLNALISTLSGVPYSTTSTSNTSGYTTGQGSSMLGQLGGLAMAGAAGYSMSDRGSKEDIELVDDEEILRKLAKVDISTYRYKPEVRDEIGDDGRVRIGPMAQDFGREFTGDPDAKMIPMPIAMGAIMASVRALEKRTRKPLKMKRAA